MSQHLISSQLLLYCPFVKSASSSLMHASLYLNVKEINKNIYALIIIQKKQLVKEEKMVHLRSRE